MKGRDRFTTSEISLIRDLIAEKSVASRGRQRYIRSKLRKIGFYGQDDWGIRDCGLDDFEALIRMGKIGVIRSAAFGDVSASSEPLPMARAHNEPSEGLPDVADIDFSAVECLRRAGFLGFCAVSDLMRDVSPVPAVRGVYMVVRRSMAQPVFLAVGSGGYHKGTNPNVAFETLCNKWVENTCVMYIGKAGGEGRKATLRSRVSQYLRFGRGEPAGHRGGRYIWQLKDSAELLFCWMPLPSDSPSSVEASLISAFKSRYGGRRPFANLVL